MKFQRKKLAVPSRIKCEPIICKQRGPPLGRCQVIKADYWHHREADKLRGPIAGMSLNNMIVGADANCSDHIEEPDTLCNLIDLFSRMRAGVIGGRLDVLDRKV